MRMRIPVIIAGIIVVAASILFFTRSDDPATQSATLQAGADEVARLEYVLDTLDTTGFSATQRQTLAIVQAEYAKQPTSYDDIVLTYTEGFEESWCADFISWVFNEAGSPFIHPDTGYWRIPGVLTLQSYYKQHGAYYEVGEYQPVFGDVAFYIGETPDGTSEEHVAIVLAVDGDTVITIGGNETSEGIVQIRSDLMQEGEQGLIGFGASAL